MGINHRGFHVLVVEEFLDCPNAIAPFQKIRRKWMPKGVAGGAFGESGFSDRTSDRFLDDGFMGTIWILDLLRVSKKNWNVKYRSKKIWTPLG